MGKRTGGRNNSSSGKEKAHECGSGGGTSRRVSTGPVKTKLCSDKDGGNIGGRGNANKFNAASERAANETPERKINARTDGVTDD